MFITSVDDEPPPLPRGAEKPPPLADALTPSRALPLRWSAGRGGCRARCFPFPENEEGTEDERDDRVDDRGGNLDCRNGSPERPPSSSCCLRRALPLVGGWSLVSAGAGVGFWSLRNQSWTVIRSSRVSSAEVLYDCNVGSVGIIRGLAKPCCRAHCRHKRSVWLKILDNVKRRQHPKQSTPEK